MELVLIWTIIPFNGNPSNHENVMVAIIHFYLLQSRLFNIFSAELSLSNRYFNAIFLSSNSEPIFLLSLPLPFDLFTMVPRERSPCSLLNVVCQPNRVFQAEISACNVIRILNSTFLLFQVTQWDQENAHCAFWNAERCLST